MKQFFTLVAAAMIAFSANAENQSIKNNITLTAPVKVSNSFKVQREKSPAKLHKARRMAKAENSSFETFLGDYVHSQWAIDPDTFDDWIASNCDVHVIDNGDGTVTIKNILGYGNIIATYNADEETLEAAPAQFLFESRYGNISLFPIAIDDSDEVIIQSESNIVFSIDSENRFMIDNDGIAMVITDGQYAGEMINYYYFFNQFDRTNATMTYLDYYNNDCSVEISIDGKPEDGVIDIYGFGDVSCPTVYVEGSEVTVPYGQSMFYYSSYGLFYLFGFQYQTLIEEDITGTYDEATKTISLNPICIVEPNNMVMVDAYTDINITWYETEDPVAIQQVKDNANISLNYDLQGRIINDIRQGQTYINNGKKYIAK